MITLDPCGGQRSPLLPKGTSGIGDPKGPKGTLPGVHCPGSRDPRAPPGEPNCGRICHKGGVALGAPPPTSPGPAANPVRSPRARPPPGPSQRCCELRRHTGPGLQGPHLGGRREAGLAVGPRPQPHRLCPQCRGSSAHSLAQQRVAGVGGMAKGRGRGTQPGHGRVRRPRLARL